MTIVSSVVEVVNDDVESINPLDSDHLDTFSPTVKVRKVALVIVRKSDVQIILSSSLPNFLLGSSGAALPTMRLLPKS